MSGEGPSLTGVSSVYDVIIGASYPIFAQTVVADSSSSALTVTITLSNPADGAFADPNAATDGSSYDSATGVFSVAGTPAQVTAAVQGLSFVPAAGANGAFDSALINVTDDLGHSTVGGPLIRIYSGFEDAIGNLSAPPVYAINGGTWWISGLAVAWLLDGAQNVTFADSGSPLDPSHRWDAVYGDGGVITLSNAALVVYGDHASVTFSPNDRDDAVSFFGPSTGGYTETVVGSNGVVIETSVAVTLTGDNDIVYFDPSDDVLNLTAATAGAWSTLYANSGVVNLAGASLSIVGGGVTVNGVSGANAVSLYQTDGVADTITGDDMTISLVNAQAVVHGDRNTIWFDGGSGSTVTVDSAIGAFDTVYGAGTIDVASGAVASVGGGALINFLSPGGFAALSYTQGVWDRVQGAAGTTNAYDAQVVVFGGNQIVRFTGGDDDMVSLNQTNGNWDSVYGSASTITLNSAQANIFGAVDDIYLNGTGSEVSFYNGANSSFFSNNIYGSNAVIDVNGVFDIHVNGGNDTIYTSQYNAIYLQATAGMWDTVYAQNQFLVLNSAQASVIGGGDMIYFEGADDAVSLYATGGNIEQINGGGGAVTLTNASATLSGDQNYVYFGPGANSLDLGISNVFALSSDDLLTFKGSFGVDTVTGFNSSDRIALSAAQFADFAAFQHAFQQQGDDAVLTLDADDKVTFVGLQTSAVTASQVTFA